MIDFIDKYDAPKKIIPLVDECEANWVEYNELSNQKLFAWIISLVGGGLFLGGIIFGNPEVSYYLSGFGAVVGVGGGFWLNHIREKLNHNVERSLLVNESLKLRGWGWVPGVSGSALYQVDR